jgi:hypothetical protein
MNDQPETDTELEDTEGHGKKFPAPDKADDTEGHAGVARRRSSSKQRTASIGEAEPDDTEGHSSSHKR